MVMSAGEEIITRFCDGVVEEGLRMRRVGVWVENYKRALALASKFRSRGEGIERETHHPTPTNNHIPHQLRINRYLRRDVERHPLEEFSIAVLGLGAAAAECVGEFEVELGFGSGVF